MRRTIIAAFILLIGIHDAIAHAAAMFAAVPSMTTPFPNSTVVEAKRWIGSGNMTHKSGPWCAYFVSFILTRTGHRALANGLAASALPYGPRLATPSVGSLAVISTKRSWAGHVGFVAGVMRDAIMLISGNWGNRVAIAVVPRRRIVACIAVDPSVSEHPNPRGAQR